MKGKNTTSRGFFRLALIKSAEGWENAGLTAQNQNPANPFCAKEGKSRYVLDFQNLQDGLWVEGVKKEPTSLADPLKCFARCYAPMWLTCSTNPSAIASNSE